MEKKPLNGCVYVCVIIYVSLSNNVAVDKGPLNGCVCVCVCVCVDRALWAQTRVYSGGNWVPVWPLLGLTNGPVIRLWLWILRRHWAARVNTGHRACISQLNVCCQVFSLWNTYWLCRNRKKSNYCRSGSGKYLLLVLICFFCYCQWWIKLVIT